MFGLGREKTRLEPVRLLASGGMGEVFLARLHREGAWEWVALKRPHKHLSRQTEWIRRFEREARICSLLQHENIVAVRDTGADAEGPYLALEYIDGWSLRQILSAAKHVGRSVPLAVALALALHLVRGLHYAHQHHGGDGDADEAGIVHRDISPDNVLVTRAGCAKLADFGLAKLGSGGTATGSGPLQGKLGYLAPELYEGSTPNGRSDLFSLSATLYELFAGTRPFEGRTEAELMRATLYAVPLPLHSLRPDLPPALGEWIGKALAHQPEKRPEKVQTLLALLESLVQDTSGVEAFLAELAQSGHVEAPVLESTRELGVAPAPWGKGTYFAAVLLLGVVGGVAVLSSRESVQTVQPKAPQQALAPVQEAEPVQGTPVHVPQVEPPPAPTKRPARKVAAPRPVPVPGSLWVRVSPWAEVFVDGRYLGVTPMPALSLSAGTHSVLLVNKDLGKHRTLSVKIAPGTTQTLKVDLSQ